LSKRLGSGILLVMLLASMLVPVLSIKKGFSSSSEPPAVEWYGTFRDADEASRTRSWTLLDIAVTNLRASKTVVGGGFSLPFNLTVENQGSQVETFNVSVYANKTLVMSRVMFLTGGISAVLMFYWNTTGLVKGNYTMTAVVEPNTLSDGWVLVTIPGDVTGDLSVDMQDISILVEKFLVEPSDSGWDWNCDVNGDSRIDMADISIAIDHFMQT